MAVSLVIVCFLYLTWSAKVALGAARSALESARVGQEVEGNISNESNSCVVCLDLTSTHVIGPCGFLCLCETCSAQCNECPLCRGNKERVIRIFMAR
jgi:hypothetical protein